MATKLLAVNTKPETYPNAYTDSPELHPNLVLGALHLLFWLFFHPSAWRNYVARIDPALRPGFGLAELSRAQWRHPLLRRLWLSGYVIWPLLIGLLVGSVGLVVEVSLYGMVQRALSGALFAVAVSVALSLTGGLTLSVALGLVSGVAGSLAIVLAATLPAGADQVLILVMAVGLALGVAGSAASSAASPIPSSREGYRLAYSAIPRHMGGIVMGILIGMVGSIVISSLALSWAEQISFSQARAMIFDMTGRGTEDVVHRIALGLEGGLAAGLAISWRTNRQRGLVFGLGFALVFSLLRLSPVSRHIPELVLMVNMAWVMALFALSYVLAENIAGPWAGTVAGALSGGGVFFLSVISNDYPRWPILPLGVACVLLGLTLPWWRPLLGYPFLVLWNLWLYRQDEQRPDAQPHLLHRHSAFWDEHQLLPLPGLAEHLVLVLERRPEEGQVALTYLTTSRQRWAAQAAQIELDARRLERCPDAGAIAQAHHRLAAGELAGPASALLRSFGRLSQDVEAALQQESAYNQRLALSAVEDRLDGLLRELTRSSEHYAVRFQPIAIRWRQLAAEHGRTLAEAAELRQEIDSPYVIGVPLTEQQEIFVGRLDISARIEQLLLDRRRPPLLLYGQRRMGKTSLLNNLGRLLPSTIIPLFIDLQGAAQASDHSGLLYNIARDMIKLARQCRNLALPPLSREMLLADPFTGFDEWLDKVEQTLTGQDQYTVLLALDEFEALDNALIKGRFAEERVLGMLRHLIQHRPCFKVLLAGSHTLAELQRWASYLINVQVVHLGYLREGEARQLIERPVQGFALRYEPEASQRVLTLTRGHPFLVQLLCAEIVALKNEQEPAMRRLACFSDVEAAAAAVLQSGSFFFADIERNQVDAAGLALLRTLASQGEGAVVTPDYLASRLGFPTAMSHTLALLIQRELIETAEEGYRFQVELMRRWFSHDQSDAYRH